MSIKRTPFTEKKDKERRRKKYKYALVKWDEHIGNWEDYPKYAVEHKDVLSQWWAGSHEVICDWEPYKVLKGMLKLLKEG